MKISNWCVIGGVLMVVFCLGWGMKYQLLWKLSYTEYAYGRLVENALEDGLLAGVQESAEALPEVNVTEATDVFRESLLKGYGLAKDAEEAAAVLDGISCIVILQKESFCVITGDEILKYPYEMRYGDWLVRFYLDGSGFCKNLKTMKSVSGTEDVIRSVTGYQGGTGHDVSADAWQRQVITECVENQMEQVLRRQNANCPYEVDFPAAKEEFCQTLEGVSMLVFMRYQTYTLDGLNCNRYVLSGARVAGQK